MGKPRGILEFGRIRRK